MSMHYILTFALQILVHIYLTGVIAEWSRAWDLCNDGCR